MIDGNGDGTLLRAVDCEICRICLVYVCMGLQRCLVFARPMWHLCKRHRCWQNRGKLANPCPNFIRSSQFDLFTLVPSVDSTQFNFKIWLAGVHWIGLISKLVFLYQYLWPCTVTGSIITNTSTKGFRASHTFAESTWYKSSTAHREVVYTVGQKIGWYKHTRHGMTGMT